MPQDALNCSHLDATDTEVPLNIAPATEVAPPIAPVTEVPSTLAPGTAKKPSFKKPVPFKKPAVKPEAPTADAGPEACPDVEASAPSAALATSTTAPASAVSLETAQPCHQVPSAMTSSDAAPASQHDLQAAPVDVASVKAGQGSSAQPASQAPSRPSLSRPAFRAPTASANANSAGPPVQSTTASASCSGPPDPSKSDKKRKGSKEPKEPRAQSAYNFFCSAKRGEVKEATPGIGFGEITKRLAEMWKALDEAGKAPYVQLANDDKARVQQLKSTMPAVPKPPKQPKKPKESKEPKAPAKPRKSKKVVETTAEDPDSLGPSISLPAASATGNPTSDIATRNAHLQGLNAAAPEDPLGNKPAADATMNTDMQCVEAEESDDELERENCDWAKHPAEAILCSTAHGKYLVKRKGLDYTEYGLVDCQLAKRQCTGDRSAPACPISAEMINRYEAHRKRFWQESHARLSRGELDLDDLNAGSPLEMCHLLGKLRDENYPLHKVDRKKSAEQDIMMSVPLMGTCLVIQTIVNNEREINMSLRAELARANEKIEHLQKDTNMLAQED